MDIGLQRRLLERAEALSITVHRRKGSFKLMLSLHGVKTVHTYIDLEKVGLGEGIVTGPGDTVSAGGSHSGRDQIVAI